MRDFCDGALLQTEEIEAERGVILSEKNSRDSVDSRLMKKQFEFLTPDYLATYRFPIGTEECIQNCPPERIRDFYRDFYDPQLMTFIVVGDIDAAVYEQRIRETFAPLTSPTVVGTPPARGSVTEPTALEVGIFTDPEVDEDDISLIRVMEHSSAPDTAQKRQTKMTTRLATSILTKRLQEIAKQEDSPINGGATYKFTWFDAITFGTFSVTPSEGRWKDTVPILEQEFRRALEHGFTTAELQEAAANLRTSAEQAARMESTRLSASISDSIVNTLNDRSVFTDAAQDLKIVEDLLATLTPEDCHQAFIDFWQGVNPKLVLTKKAEEADDKDTLLRLYTQSQAIAVAAPEEKEIGAFAYTAHGAPSSITQEHYIEDLDTHQMTLSNGIRVNLKQTDFDKGQILMTARLGGGLSTLADMAPGWHSYASALVNLGGVGAHSSDELGQVLSGKVVGLSFGVAQDAYTFSGATTQQDLETQLLLLGAYLTDPGFRPEADRLYKKALPDQYENLRQTLEGSMQSLSAFVHGGDSRFAIPTEEQAMAFTPEQVTAPLRQRFANAPLELTLVGDLELEATKQALQNALGMNLSVPQLGAESRRDRLPIQPLTTLPDTGQQQTFTYQSKLDRAATILSWKTTGLTTNIAEGRRMSLLSQIIGNRMREVIREKLGSSYSPYAYSDMNDTFENLGEVKAVAICKAADQHTIAKLVLQIGADLATDGATQDELDRVQNPAIASIESTLRKNTYWLNTVLARSQAQPKRLDWARSRTSDYESITLEEINALATQHLQPENANTYLLKSELN